MNLSKLNEALESHEAGQAYSDLEFYCSKDKASKRHGIAQCCFTHLVGLPRHPATNEAMPLMDYQAEFYHNTHTSKNRKFHVNKSRQMGFSELILRILQYDAFSIHKGGKIIIMAGTASRTTKDIMNRLYQLFSNIRHTVKRHDNNVIELTNGTQFLGLPANPDSIRGFTKIDAILLDESASWDLISDQKVLDSVMPIVNTNKSMLYMISTPKGMRGFFYNIDKEREPDFDYFTYSIYEAVDHIYTIQECEDMLKDNSIDTEQEYLNKFTSSRNSIFGEITEDMTDDYMPEDLDLLLNGKPGEWEAYHEKMLAYNNDPDRIERNRIRNEEIRIKNHGN